MTTNICKKIALIALIPLIAVINSTNAGVNPATKAAGVVQSQSGNVKQVQLAKGQNQLPAQKSQTSC